MVTYAENVVMNDDQALGAVRPGRGDTGRFRMSSQRSLGAEERAVVRRTSVWAGWFRNLALRYKLTVITMVTSCVALLLACLVFVANEQVHSQRRMADDLRLVASLTVESLSRNLSFDDFAGIEQTLQSLRAHPRVTTAIVYRADGRIVGQYRRLGAVPVAPLALREPGLKFNGRGFDLFEPIGLVGKKLGTLYLQGEIHEVREQVWRFLFSVGAVLVVCSSVAFLMAARLQRLISQPIADLARTVAIVATQRNYSIRAEKRGEDEIGRLIEGFNDMLGQIQQRDSALLGARNELEAHVDQRTNELAESVSLLNATLDSTADGILAVSFSGEIVCANAQFGRMWGTPSNVRERLNADELAAFNAMQVRDPAAYLAPLDRGYVPQNGEVFDIVELINGRTFERCVKPQRVNGEAVGLVISFRDISARRRAEEELRKVNDRLLETSRLAGMAEVATGVLHNVGNVLNSVNVGATCMADKLQRSRVPNLAKVVALLREHESDLGRYITTDPKGRQVPAYLAQLADHLAGEKAMAAEELAVLQRNIEHIKEIVAMQQNYARISGVVEMVEVQELVEDSLRMNAGALVRHDVQLVRDFVPVPPITVEKHKVLQILVNLIRNAKYACDDAGRAEKQMTVRIRGDATGVQISVIDNGIGIPEENLTRIFSHGFTTRKDGHGFGLHSGSLAAKEMGGALTVFSAGERQGAAFTLELPLQPPA
jgi:signal transduction histidine kinase